MKVERNQPAYLHEAWNPEANPESHQLAQQLGPASICFERKPLWTISENRVELKQELSKQEVEIEARGTWQKSWADKHAWSAWDWDSNREKGWEQGWSSGSWSSRNSWSYDGWDQRYQ